MEVIYRTRLSLDLHQVAYGNKSKKYYLFFTSNERDHNPFKNKSMLENRPIIYYHQFNLQAFLSFPVILEIDSPISTSLPLSGADPTSAIILSMHAHTRTVGFHGNERGKYSSGHKGVLSYSM